MPWSLRGGTRGLLCLREENPGAGVISPKGLPVVLPQPDTSHVVPGRVHVEETAIVLTVADSVAGRVSFTSMMSCTFLEPSNWGYTKDSVALITWALGSFNVLLPICTL